MFCIEIAGNFYHALKDVSENIFLTFNNADFLKEQFYFRYFYELVYCYYSVQIATVLQFTNVLFVEFPQISSTTCTFGTMALKLL